MKFYIDYPHNYPPSEYIDSGNREEWISDVISIGLRYNNENHVVLEPINEYTGSDQVSLFNWGMQRIRAEGITLPLLWNFWWNQKIVALDDPLNNYAVGRHFYGKHQSYNPSTPIDLDYAIDSSGVGNSLYNYFYGSSNMYLQEVKRLGIPNGFVVTELGPYDGGGSYENHPSVGDMAYAMGFIREAIKNDVDVALYSVGASSTGSTYNKLDIYEELAQEYFNEGYCPDLD